MEIFYNVILFQGVYGVSPPTLLTYVPNTTKVQQVVEELSSRDLILQFLKDSLVLTRERVEKFVDALEDWKAFQDWRL